MSDQEYIYEISVDPENVCIEGKLTTQDMIELIQYFSMRGYVYITAGSNGYIILSRSFE